MTSYLLDELATEFWKITETNMEDVMNSAEKEYNLENAQQLLHQTILYANKIGGPIETALHWVPSINPGIMFIFYNG